MERKMSLPSFLALEKASGHQANQSTGLCACCRRYGLLSLASRLVSFLSSQNPRLGMLSVRTTANATMPVVGRDIADSYNERGFCLFKASAHGATIAEVQGGAKG